MRRRNLPRRPGEPLLDSIEPMPYAAVGGLDAVSKTPYTQSHIKAGFLRRLDDGAIAVLATLGREAFPPLRQIEIRQLGGTFARPVPDAASFRVETNAPLGVEAERATADSFARLEPSLAEGANLDFLRGDEPARVSSAFSPEDWERLRRINRHWGPENRLSLTVNVEP